MSISTRESDWDATESTGAPMVPGRADRVLLLGVARSGTRWLATALGHTEGARLVKEPDNVTAHDFGPYPVIDPNAAAFHYRALWDLAFSARVPSGEAPGWGLRVGRAALRLPRRVRDPFLHRTAQVIAAWPGRPQRVVVKSIYAQFAVDWLLRNYRPKVIVIQRHPLNVVSSWLELGVDGFDLLSRPVVRERYLEPLGIPQPARYASRTQLTATWVGLLSTVLAEHVERHPEWLLVTHEELCEEPEASIHRVCMTLGLTWTDEVARFLADSNRPGQGFSNVRVTREQSTRWRSRLTGSQIMEIEAVLAQFPQRGWVLEPGTVPGASPPL